MAIIVFCPGCQVRLTLKEDRAGEAITCPRCEKQIRIPKIEPEVMPAKLPEKANTRAKPIAKPAKIKPVQPSANAFQFQADSDDADEDDDDSDYIASIPSAHKRQSTILAWVWRGMTLGLLSLVLITYLLPWIRYSFTIPILFSSKREFLLCHQSGAECILGAASVNPALEYELKQGRGIEDANARAAGKDPAMEEFNRMRKNSAPLLVLAPALIGLAGLLVLINRPSIGSMFAVGVPIFASLLVVIIQFGLLGPPLERRIYEESHKNGEAGFLIAVLLLNVGYTIAFYLMIFFSILALVVQPICFVEKLLPFKKGRMGSQLFGKN